MYSSDVVYLPDTQLIQVKLPQYADLFAKRKNFSRWWQDVSARPAWKKVAAQSEF
jgi:glutathione S-transferase